MDEEGALPAPARGGRRRWALCRLLTATRTLTVVSALTGDSGGAEHLGDDTRAEYRLQVAQCCEADASAAVRRSTAASRSRKS